MSNTQSGDINLRADVDVDPKTVSDLQYRGDLPPHSSRQSHSEISEQSHPEISDPEISDGSALADTESGEATTIPILRLDLGDPDAIRKAWIPFLLYGGFRLTTERRFRLGQRIDLELRLPGDTQPQLLMTRVALIEPGDSATGLGGRIGLHLTARDQSHMRRRIDGLLSGMVQSGTVQSR